jgi:hypothetical protein
MEERLEEAPVGLVDETPMDESVVSGDDLGAEMWPDASDEDNPNPEDSTSTPPAPSENLFDPAQVNAARTTEGEVPEELRPLFNAMQEQFKGLQTTLNERNLAFEELQRTSQAAAPQTNAPAAVQQIPRSGANPYPFLEDRINIALQNGQITHEQAATSRAEMIDGAEQVEKIVSHLFTPYMPYLNLLPQLAQAVGGMMETTETQTTVKAEGAYNEAKAVYGTNVDAWKPMIEKLVGDVNPATGQPFTFDTATRHLLGITAEQATQLRSKHQAAVNGARLKLGRPVAQATGATPAPRHLNAEQAQSRMKKAGWDS